MPRRRSPARRATCSTSGYRSAAGYLASLRLAAMAHAAGHRLSTWLPSGRNGRAFGGGATLGMLVANIRYLEGSYDRHVFQRPLTNEDMTFGYGGRRRRSNGRAWRYDERDDCSTSLPFHGRSFRLVMSPVATSKLVTLQEPPTAAQLAVHVWRYSRHPHAPAVFLHGISSHAGWYDRGNEQLAAAGVEVHFLDRRGSGEDVESRGDVDHWQTWIDDVAIYLRQLRAARSDARRAMRHQLGRQTGGGGGSSPCGLSRWRGAYLPGAVLAVRAGALQAACAAGARAAAIAAPPPRDPAARSGVVHGLARVANDSSRKTRLRCAISRGDSHAKTAR